MIYSMSNFIEQSNLEADEVIDELLNHNVDFDLEYDLVYIPEDLIPQDEFMRRLKNYGILGEGNNNNHNSKR